VAVPRDVERENRSLARRKRGDQLDRLGHLDPRLGDPAA
jgi:hypothetical protein